MARPRSNVRPVEWKVNVPVDLAASVEELLYDPALKKPRYGSRSELISSLLQLWLDHQYAQANAPPAKPSTGQKVSVSNEPERIKLPEPNE